MPAAFDPKRAAITHRRNLPHMRQENAVYFVTFRTADSVPAERIRQWQAEAQRQMVDDSEEGGLRTHVAREVERWLDRGLGECPLADPSAGRIVADALRFFDEDRYLLDEYVVMPNHVHALVCPLPGHELSEVLQSWKGYTAREVNKLLGRRGSLWQDETFDHIVRDTQALIRFREYIRSNPEKAPGKHSITGRGRFGEVTGV